MGRAANAGRVLEDNQPILAAKTLYEMCFGKTCCRRGISTGHGNKKKNGGELKVLAASDACYSTPLAGWVSNLENYLYVAFVRTIMSRCCVKSTMELNAGPPSGCAFISSRSAALTLSMPSAFPVM